MELYELWQIGCEEMGEEEIVCMVDLEEAEEWK